MSSWDSDSVKRFQNTEKGKSFGARRKGKREVGEVVTRAFSPRIAHR